MSDTLLILGASTRAAAFSARRAGWTPHCGDRFADVDLRACCAVKTPERYPYGLEAIAAGAPPGAWLYTGALENYPDLVDRIGRSRPLYGNPAATLRQVRDPLRVAQVLSRAGLASAPCLATAEDIPRDGRWLRKRRRSAGGVHVQVWGPQTTAPPSNPAWYFQKRIDGTPCAAVYVAAGGQARLLGVTEQLYAAGLSAAGHFYYGGSVGPLRLPAAVEAGLAKIGDVLSRAFRLTGLFGVDAILAGDTAWPVEVNPRYTASIEVLERGLGFAAVALHVDACLSRKLLPPAAPPATRWYGKAVLYARAGTTVTTGFTAHLLGQNLGLAWPAAADIPTPGMRLRANQPVTTALAEAESRAALIEELRDRLFRWEELLCR